MRTARPVGNQSASPEDSGAGTGVNPKAVQEFMGHATIEETFSRYGHLMPGARDQARELVDAYLDRAVA
jgi:integrase